MKTPSLRFVSDAFDEEPSGNEKSDDSNSLAAFSFCKSSLEGR